MKIHTSLIKRNLIKSANKYVYLLLLLIVGSFQLNAKEYAEMSKTELNKVLVSAVLHGHPNRVEEVIKAGADINCVNEDKNTPLIRAVKDANAYAEFSLQAQAKSRSNWYGKRKAIDALLKAKPNINHVNKQGRTALMEAVIRHDLRTVKSLLANPQMGKSSYCGLGTLPINYADNDGNTALILAMKHVRDSYIVGNTQEYRLCQDSHIILKLISKVAGVDHHHVNKKGESFVTLYQEYQREHSL